MLIFLQETFIVDLTVLGNKNEKREALQFQQLKINFYVLSKKNSEVSRR
jgi:hypothetical protein